MAIFRYPRSDFDKAENLLGVLGNFWSDIYEGKAVVEDTVSAVGNGFNQIQADFLTLLQSLSRKDITLFHVENWQPIRIRQSELNADSSLRLLYGEEGAVYGDSLEYGQASLSAKVATLKPVSLITSRLLLNNIVTPSVTLQHGLDYLLAGSAILFAQNPFDNTLISQREIQDATGAIIDREILLWNYRGEYDRELLYSQFGYVLGLKLQTSEAYKSLLNVVFDSFVTGTNKKSQELFFSAVFGIPLVVESRETVEKILFDSGLLQIVTNAHVYQYPEDSNPIVSVGDEVSAGQSLVDDFQLIELGAGPDIARETLSGLAIDSSLLGFALWGDVVFENAEFPLVTEIMDDGTTKVSWNLGGFPADVLDFWELVHAKGLEANKTLAMALSVKEEATPEVNPKSLPATINPLLFLTQNLLRNNVTLIKVRARRNSRSLAFFPAEQFRRLQPPGSLLLLIIELSQQELPISIIEEGTDISPGGIENLSGFVCMTAAESMVAEDFVSERVRTSRIGIRCR